MRGESSVPGASSSRNLRPENRAARKARRADGAKPRSLKRISAYSCGEMRPFRFIGLSDPDPRTAYPARTLFSTRHAFSQRHQRTRSEEHTSELQSLRHL